MTGCPDGTALRPRNHQPTWSGGSGTDVGKKRRLRKVQVQLRLNPVGALGALPYGIGSHLRGQLSAPIACKRQRERLVAWVRVAGEVRV